MTPTRHRAAVAPVLGDGFFAQAQDSIYSSATDGVRDADHPMAGRTLHGDVLADEDVDVRVLFTSQI